MSSRSAAELRGRGSTGPRAGSLLRIVFVCTGNSFRSPLAAAYLRRLLLGVGHVEITTCGTVAATRGLHAPLPEAIELAASSGLNLTDHRTTFVEDVDLSDADLVIGFERAHATAAVVAGHAAPSRTFLLRELVELLRFLDVPASNRAQHFRDVVARADELRAARDVSGHSLADPYGRSRRFQWRMARELRELIVELASMLFTDVEQTTAILPSPRLIWRRGRLRQAGASAD